MLRPGLVVKTINETNTNLLLANARVLLALTPVTNKVGVYLGGGGALLTRGRNTFDDDRSNTDLGGTVGLGFRFGSGNNSRVGLRLDIEDYLYNGDFGGGNDFQNDIVTSLGVSIALGGRASDESVALLVEASWACSRELPGARPLFLELEPHVYIDQHPGIGIHEHDPVLYPADNHALERTLSLAAAVIAAPEVHHLVRANPLAPHNLVSRSTSTVRVTVYARSLETR